MAIYGPPKKPSVIEIAEGCPGKRKPNKLEPRPGELTAASAVAACPPEFTAGQRKWWTYYAARFCDSRVLTELDLVMLGKLAKTTDERERMEVKLAEVGPLYKNENSGVIKVSPLFTVVDRLREIEFRLLREFGASPSSRAGVSMVSAPNSSADLIDMLSKPRAREAVQ